MDEYPEEIRLRPIPLVALFGGQDLHGPILRATTVRKEWNREAPVLRYLSKEIQEQLPKRRDAREKRVGDLTHPEGILKTSWMYKVANLKPSAAAMFFDWDATDSRSKEAEFAGLVDAMRASAGPVPVLIVLIRKQDPIDNNEERFGLFRRRVNLDPRIFVSFVRNDELNSAKTVEANLLRLAYEYFDNEAKRWKREKEKLSKALHQKMYARHHFKIAYYCETRQDLKTSLKYYYSSYSFLRDAKKQISEFTEIKTLADFIDFKVCLLYMERGAVADAVSQFHRHMNYYKSLFDPDREFHHLAWVSRQYHSFAQLLEAFPQYQAIPKVRGWTHPGFYYQAAANTHLERRKNAIKLCEPFRNDPEIIKLVSTVKAYQPAVISMENQTYIGQRLDWLAMDSSHPFEGQKEGQAPLNWAIAQELNVQHAPLAIQMLLRALASYQLDSMPADRLVWAITAQIGHLYFLINDIAKSKEYLENVANRYRSERWWDLLSDVVSDLLECAKKSSNAPDIVNYSLELISKQMRITLDQKKQIQQQLLNMIRQSGSVISTPQKISIEDNHPLFKCQVRFEKDTACVHADVAFTVRISAELPSPVRFNRLRVLFSDPSHNQTLADGAVETIPSEVSQLNGLATQPDNLLFVSNKTKTFVFNFNMKHQTIIQCVGVSLELGQGDSLVSFYWNIALPKALNKASFVVAPISANRPSIEILEHEAFLDVDIDHEPPALHTEYCPVRLKLQNKHDKIVSGKLLLQSNQIDATDRPFYSQAAGSTEKVAIDELALPPIETGATTPLDFFYYVPKAIDQTQIKVKAVYDTINYSTSCERTFTIPVKSPFKVTFEVFNVQFQPIAADLPTRLLASDKFFLRVDLHSSVPFSLELLHIDLLETETSKQQWKENTSSYHNAEPIKLHPEETFTVWFSIQPQIAGQIDLGALVVDWRRISLIDPVTSKTSTKIEAPKVDIYLLDYTVDIATPLVAKVGKAIQQRVVIKNLTDGVAEFKFEVQNDLTTSAFAVSGPTKTTLQLNPKGSHAIELILVPLTAGRAALPRVGIKPQLPAGTVGTSVPPKVDLAPYWSSKWIFVEPDQSSKLV